MNFVYALAKLLGISEKSFVTSMSTFSGLPHRYEIFLKKKGITFINDSKATNFQATKFALISSKNIYWIIGGLPKKKDKIDLKFLKKNIIKSYIVGKKINFFKKQLQGQIKYEVTSNLKTSVLKILKDIKDTRINQSQKSIVLLSPSAASFDQYKNFELRGNEFKKICKFYAKKLV